MKRKEMEILVQALECRPYLVSSQFGRMSMRCKERTQGWTEVANELNACCVYRVLLDADAARGKWNDLKYRVRKKAAKEGEKQFNELEVRVLDLIRKDVSYESFKSQPASNSKSAHSKRVSLNPDESSNLEVQPWSFLLASLQECSDVSSGNETSPENSNASDSFQAPGPNVSNTESNTALTIGNKRKINSVTEDAKRRRHLKKKSHLDRLLELEEQKLVLKKETLQQTKRIADSLEALLALKRRKT